MPVPVTNSRDLQRLLLPGQLPHGRHLRQLQLPSGGPPPGRPAELLQLRAQLPRLPSACALPEGLQPGARTQVLPHILALVDSSYAHIGCIQGPSKSMPDARRSGSTHDAGGGSSSRPFATSVRMLRCSGQRRFPAHRIMSALEQNRKITCMATTAAPSKTPPKTSALLSTSTCTMLSARCGVCMRTSSRGELRDALAEALMGFRLAKAAAAASGMPYTGHTGSAPELPEEARCDGIRAV